MTYSPANLIQLPYSTTVTKDLNDQYPGWWFTKVAYGNMDSYLLPNTEHFMFQERSFMVWFLANRVFADKLGTSVKAGRLNGRTLENNRSGTCEYYSLIVHPADEASLILADRLISASATDRFASPRRHELLPQYEEVTQLRERIRVLRNWMYADSWRHKEFLQWCKKEERPVPEWRKIWRSVLRGGNEGLPIPSYPNWEKDWAEYLLNN